MALLSIPCKCAIVADVDVTVCYCKESKNDLASDFYQGKFIIHPLDVLIFLKSLLKSRESEALDF